MNIAILSGKGGTGKTTVATNLSIILGVNYVDLDVEEPNGFIFLKPLIKEQDDVYVEYPVIDKAKCVLCSACAQNCQFHALARAGKEIVVFEKLCHDCGVCKLVCQTGAISYAKRPIGKLERGIAKSIYCYRGVLNVGEPMAVPVIQKCLKDLPVADYFLDCPPGTSCNVVASLKKADAAILVTEPSEFGLQDLKIAVDLVKLYKIPYGIVINKDDDRDNMVKKYCLKNAITLLGVIPYSMDAAKRYSKGMMLCEDTYYQSTFITLAQKIKEVFAW